MQVRVKIYGPPGTGKTTSLIQKCILPFPVSERNDIAVVSLTRATKQAFLETLKKHEVDFNEKNVRTMHSWAYFSYCYETEETEERQVKKPVIVETKKEVFKKCIEEVFDGCVEDSEIEDAQKFLETMQYSQKIEIAQWQACIKVRTSWAVNCHFYEEWIPRFVRKEGSEFGISRPEEFTKLYLKYKDWKLKNGVYDFTDFLMMSLQGQVNPFKKFKNKGFMVIVDEIQDLYPLAFAVLLKYQNVFHTVILAGDDDQTIFEFAGARPELFLYYPGQEIVLSQSYRLPKQIYEYSLKIIKQNKIRREKDFLPRNEEGIVDTIPYENLLDFLSETRTDTMILCRTNYIVDEYVQFLENYDIPYRLILSPRVQVKNKILCFLEIHDAIQKGQEVSNKETLEKYLDEVVYPYVRARMGESQLRSEKKELITQALLKRSPALAKKYGIVVQEILSKPLYMIAIKLDKNIILKWKRRFPRREEWKNPKLKVGTIHSAKGLEVDRVLVDPRITRKIEEEMTTTEGLEAERRVWYVACTRARRELYVIEPPFKRFSSEVKTFPLPEIA